MPISRCYDPSFGSEPEPDKPDLKYVVRGGSFMDNPEVAYRVPARRSTSR